MRTIEDVLNDLRSLFVEMPDRRLKPEEVQLLCSIDPTICRMLLKVLVDEVFLCIKPDGQYARVIDRKRAS